MYIYSVYVYICIYDALFMECCETFVQLRDDLQIEILFNSNYWEQHTHNINRLVLVGKSQKVGYLPRFLTSSIGLKPADFISSSSSAKCKIKIALCSTRIFDGPLQVVQGKPFSYKKKCCQDPFVACSDLITWLKMGKSGRLRRSLMIAGSFMICNAKIATAGNAKQPVFPSFLFSDIKGSSNTLWLMSTCGNNKRPGNLAKKRHVFLG